MAAPARSPSPCCPGSATGSSPPPGVRRRSTTCASWAQPRSSTAKPCPNGKLIARERWVGAIDTVGSHTLANVLAQTGYRGVVAAFGMVQGHDLPGSVLPFIRRNITLAGIDAVNAPQAVRLQAWSRLARDLDLSKLSSTTQVVGLTDVPDVAQRILQGQVRGRTVVNVNA